MFFRFLDIIRFFHLLKFSFFRARFFYEKTAKNALCNYTQFRAILFCLHLRKNHPIFDK